MVYIQGFFNLQHNLNIYIYICVGYKIYENIMFKYTLTVFGAFGYGVHEVREGDVHRRPLGQMTQSLGLAWRDHYFDRTGFPVNRYGIDN